MRKKSWRMSCDVDEATEGLENQLWCRWSDGKFGEWALLILQTFPPFTYVTAHSPTLPLLHLHHSSFSNPSFASPTSQALHLRQAWRTAHGISIKVGWLQLLTTKSLFISSELGYVIPIFHLDENRYTNKILWSKSLTIVKYYHIFNRGRPNRYFWRHVRNCRIERKNYFLDRNLNQGF